MCMSTDTDFTVNFHLLTFPAFLLRWYFFSPGATTPNGGCILQPSSGL